MRVLVLLIFAVTSIGCSGLMVGGGSSGSASAGEQQTTDSAAAVDAATTERVKAKIVADPDLRKYELDVSTNAGMVTLSGTVSAYAARENAEKLAMASDGVKAVDNQITVENSK